MKQWIQVIGFAVVIAGGTVQISQAQQTVLPLRAVHKIHDNALLAKHNAAIFQWERVDDDVDRIVAAARSIHKALSSDAANTLDQQVHELRSARLARDEDRLVAVAEKLSELSADLLKSAK